MTYYAIRHMPTGNYLPHFGRRRGHTHAEPVPLGVAAPRLFTKRQYAQYALRCWLQGAWREHHNYDSYTGEYDCWGPEPPAAPPKDRKPEDMEITVMSIMPWQQERLELEATCPK